MEHLPVEMRKYAASKTAISEILETDERLAMLQALEASAWNVAKAARKLGIGRRTIYRKIGLYQLKPRNNKPISTLQIQNINKNKLFCCHTRETPVDAASKAFYNV